MTEDDSAPATHRLLAVTLATHDAFAQAASVVRAPGYAAEFAQRAEYHGRLATHLRGLSAPEGMASDAMRRMPDVVLQQRMPEPGDGDPRTLFSACLRILDAATLEFCRAIAGALCLSNATRVAYPINTTIQGESSHE
jgi:hypothetical protein